MTLLEPHNWPFAAALLLMALLALVQAIGLGDMFDSDAGIELDTDMDGDAALHAGTIEGLSSLFGFGRVPLTIWLAIYLFLFAGIGLGIQELAQSFTGSPLYVWLAALISGGAALPVTGVLARPVGAVLPKDETTAVSTASLVGRRGQITEGIARRGSPARAKVKDVHGHNHFVMVEPHEDKSELHAGDDVLLVRREDNQFYATALAERRLSPTVK